jgi:hypothetical protein
MQQEKNLEIDFREIFRVVRFSTLQQYPTQAVVRARTTPHCEGRSIPGHKQPSDRNLYPIICCRESLC